MDTVRLTVPDLLVYVDSEREFELAYILEKEVSRLGNTSKDTREGLEEKRQCQ